jgi:AcrR family transcriptional regulator
MDMTAGAIYSYFATRDDLVTTLIGDVYGSVVEAAESARDAASALGEYRSISSPTSG